MPAGEEMSFMVVGKTELTNMAVGPAQRSIIDRTLNAMIDGGGGPERQREAADLRGAVSWNVAPPRDQGGRKFFVLGHPIPRRRKPRC